MEDTVEEMYLQEEHTWKEEVVLSSTTPVDVPTFETLLAMLLKYKDSVETSTS